MSIVRVLLGFGAVCAVVVLLALGLRPAAPAGHSEWTVLGVQAAIVGGLVAAGTGVAHATVLPRLERRRAGDVLIAIVGVIGGAIALAAALAAWFLPPAAPGVLLATCPVWIAGVLLGGWGIAVLSAGSRRRVPARMGSIVVLGGGLRQGRPGPLLVWRLDRARALWPGSGVPIIVSGARIGAEPVSEADAMADWLSAQGVPDDVVLREQCARSTGENLAFAVRDLAPSPPVVVVTSDYHVLRTRLLALALGVRVTVVGAASSPLYRPGAIAREFAALIISPRELRRLRHTASSKRR